MRYQYLDILRGLCIVLMILFHLNYSLVNIFDSEILNFSESFWFILGKISALGFMIISGISFCLAKKKYSEQNLRNKYFKYSGMLALIAVGITLGTYILIPEQLILFGILHLFAVSFFLLAFVSKLGYYCGILAGVFILLGLIFPIPAENRFLFPLGFINFEFYSADYYPLVPYFGYILLGFFIGKCMQKYKLFRYVSLSREMNYLEKFLSNIGKKSLLLYLIHQPIIVGIIWITFR